MRLDPGSSAPPFDLSDWKGERHRLADYRGRNLWLAFFRYASCPLCNLRIQQMIRAWADWPTDRFTLLCVFQSPASSIAEFVGQQAPPFPLLADPSEALYRRYGLESSMRAYLAPSNATTLAKAATAGFLPGRMEGTKSRIPGDFFIDGEGTIVEAFYGRTIADHVPFDRALDWLAAGA